VWGDLGLLASRQKGQGGGEKIMFQPNFRYTNRIVNNLTQIAEGRTIILNAPLVPKWEVTLRREAIIRSAHSSTAIEGNPLSLEQVSDLAAGREITVRRKDRQEVLNYLEALEKIPEFAQRSPFKSEDLLEVHKTVTKETLENPGDEGVFRNRQVFVGNRITGEVIFTPPPTEQVPQLVNEFLEWFNSTAVSEIDPVIEAGLTHYELVRIHPFIDGNGRTARVLATLILYLRGFDTKQFFCLDDYYDLDRPSYYRVLQSVDQRTLDLTNWLEYFVEGVKVSIEAVKERVVRLSSERLRRTKKGQIALTEKQMRIVEFINENGRITNRNVREMFKISSQAAHKEIMKLVKPDVIKAVGKGRNISYQLKVG
jgi:Fic family protein